MAKNLTNSSNIQINESGNDINLDFTNETQGLIDKITTNEEKINDLVSQKVYSTAEIDTGDKWINGKPIYKKTFAIIGITTTQKFMDISSLNKDLAWIDVQNSFYKSNDGTDTGIIDDWDSGSRVSLVIASNSLYYKSNNNRYDRAWVTLRYTKTTD